MPWLCTTLKGRNCGTNSGVLCVGELGGSLLWTPLTVDLGLDWLVPWGLLCLLGSEWCSVVIRESLRRNAFHWGLRRNLSWVWQAPILRFSWLIMKIAERLSHRARLTEPNVSDGTYLMNVLACFQKYGDSALVRINAREWPFILRDDETFTLCQAFSVCYALCTGNSLIVHTFPFVAVCAYT